MLVCRIRGAIALQAFRVPRTVKNHIIPGAHTGHQLDAQEISQPKDRFTLSLGVGMNSIGLQSGGIFQQSIQNINGLPYPTSNEVAE